MLALRCTDTERQSARALARESEKESERACVFLCVWMHANLLPLLPHLDVFHAHSKLFPWEREQFSTPRSARRPEVRVFGSFPSQPLLTPCGFLSLFFSLFIFVWFFDVHVVSFLCEGGVSRGGVCVFFLPLFACIDVSRRKKRREACVLSEVLFWS